MIPRMATAAHVAVGAALGRLFFRHPPSLANFLLAQVVFIGLAIAPDLDLFGYFHGVRYLSEFGHRGASHSLAAALLLALAVALIGRIWEHPFWRTFALAFIAAASHGLLDMLTSGGQGIALLWPLDNHRYLFPWRPIPAAPIGGRLFYSWRGWGIVAEEFAWGLPLFVYAWFPRGWFRR